MADKSVIQMSEQAHREHGEAALISAVHMFKAERREHVTTGEASAYAAGFERAWELSHLCAQREGNCRFEGGK